MTVEEWVRKLNKLARKMDHDCDGTHPSAWAEITKVDREKWKRLIKERTNDTRGLH